MASKARGTPAQRLVRLAIRIGVTVGIVAFAVEGGEYGTSDIVSQKSQRIALEAEIDTLTRMVDSLLVWKRLVETDPVTQERVAREEFGMVRGDRELLYRFIEPPTAGREGR